MLQRPKSTVEDKELELFAEEIPPVSAGNGPGDGKKQVRCGSLGGALCFCLELSFCFQRRAEMWVDLSFCF